MANIYKLKFTIQSSETADTSYDRFWILVTTGSTSSEASNRMTGATECEYITTGRSGGDCEVCYFTSTASSFYLRAACVSPGSTPVLVSAPQVYISSTATTYPITVQWNRATEMKKRLITSGIVSFFNAYKSNPKAILASGTTFSLGSSKGYTSDGGSVFNIYSNGSIVPSPGKRRYGCQCFCPKRSSSANFYYVQPGYTVYVDTSVIMVNNNMANDFYHMYTYLYVSGATFGGQYPMIQSTSSSMPVEAGSSNNVPFNKPSGNQADGVTYLIFKMEGYWNLNKPLGYWGFHVHDPGYVISADIEFGPDDYNFSTGNIITVLTGDTHVGNITVELYD